MEGAPIDTRFDGGLNNIDGILMAENCFKIIAFYDESDRQLKQFSRLSPISYLLSSVMNALGNVKQDDAANLTAPHAMTSNVKEDFVFGLSREG